MIDEIEIARQAHKDRNAYFTTLHKARILDARSFVQIALYVNGLAASALIAFLGAMATNKAVTHLPRAFVWGLGLFGVGVLLAAFVAAASYATDHAYANSSRAKQAIWKHPYLEDTLASLRHDKHARWAHVAAYACTCGTLLAFLAGVSAAVIGFDRLR